MQLIFLCIIFIGFSRFHEKRECHLPHRRRRLRPLFTEKKSVDIKDINSIRMDRHPYSLKGIFFMDVLIQTRGNGLVRIPTYNILPEPEFYKAVELHVLSYMTEEARRDWIGQFTEAQRKAYLNQFHKNA